MLWLPHSADNLYFKEFPRRFLALKKALLNQGMKLNSAYI